MDPQCYFCKRLSEITSEPQHPFLVYEFKHSVLIVGDHQTYPGYCVLVLRDHVKELHELSPEVSRAFHEEMIQAGTAIQRAFRPEKMNYSNYGNMTPHLHWHIFPREKDGVNWPNPPFTVMNDFKNHPTSNGQAIRLGTLVRRQLSK